MGAAFPACEPSGTSVAGIVNMHIGTICPPYKGIDFARKTFCALAQWPLSKALMELPPTTTPSGEGTTHLRPRDPLRGPRCVFYVGRDGIPSPMIPKTCQLGSHRIQEKPASFYWAWVRTDGRRKAYRQQVCRSCAQEHYVRIILAASECDLLTCPACGIDTTDDYDAVYLTYCIPGAPKAQVEMPLCGPCAAELRIKALQGAMPLEDRGVGVGGPQFDAPSAAETWAALGLAPKARG